MGGRTDFLAKPFRIGEIRARLMRLLGAEEVGG
jgi:DNA-binding response OmpR family regulator